MTSEGESLVIELGTIRSSAQLLQLLNQTLALGESPGGGADWNTLCDSFTYLGTGGVWGNGRKFLFPLHFNFTGSDLCRRADPAGFSMLSVTLESTRAFYLRNRIGFSYEFS